MDNCRYVVVPFPTDDKEHMGDLQGTVVRWHAHLVELLGEVLIYRLHNSKLILLCFNSRYFIIFSVAACYDS